MGLAGGFDCLELELGRGLARRDALAMLFGVTSKGDHLPIPGGIQVPVFSFTPTSPPAVRASPLRGCGLIPPACARGSAPFVSIHTLLELGAQYTFIHNFTGKHVENLKNALTCHLGQQASKQASLLRPTLGRWINWCYVLVFFF